MEKEERQQCKNCRFWSREQTSCHRYPPAPDFPYSHECNWCGEWRGEEDPQKRLI